MRRIWYDQRPWALVLCVLAWVLAFYCGARALSTAHIWMYLACYVLVIFGLNRLARTIRG